MGDTGLGPQRIKQLIDDAEMKNLSMVLVVILCACVLINRYLKNTHKYALAAKIPGLPLIPLIGNGHYFIGINLTNIVQKLFQLKAKYGFPQRIWLGSELVVALSDPKDIEPVLTSQHALNKSYIYDFFCCQGEGTFTAKGEKWHRLRKLVSSTFHIKLLEQFVHVFNKQSKILAETLAQKADTGVFDVHDHVARCTLDMVCGSQMGTTTKEQLENTSNFAHNLYKSTEIILMRAHKAHLHPDFIFNLTKHHKQNQEFIKPLHKFAAKVITERKQIRENITTSDKNANEIKNLETNKKRNIYLDALLDANPDKTLQELTLTSFDMFLGGSDTSAAAISYCFLMLAMHQDIQEKVFKEQCDIFAKIDTASTLADINEMKYLDMVIKESLRLSAAPAILRQVSKDIDIENYTLPAGSIAYISIYSAHRDIKYWQNPNIFYPEHFSPENLAKRPKYCFLPFSMGPRNCPGHKYAMLSMKLVISHIVRKYKITTALKFEELTIEMSLMTLPAQGFPISLHSRS